MAWVSPTSHEDPDSGWTNPTYAYDGNDGTAATDDGQSKWLILNIDPPISCDSVRYYAAWLDYVDVYYSGGWHTLSLAFVGTLSWQTVEIGSTETVSAARVHDGTFTGHSIALYEFEFNEAGAATYTTAPSLDVLLQQADSESVALDVLLEAIDAATVALDLRLNTVESSAVALDIILADASSVPTAALSALLRGTVAHNVDLDTHVAARAPETVGLDALLCGPALSTVALDVSLGVMSAPTIALDMLVVSRTPSSVALDMLLVESPLHHRGTLHIEAIGLLAQLEKEVVTDYSADDKATNTIVSELLALQEHPVPITLGTIDYTDNRSIDVPKDTILGALNRLHESVGGYMYVDSDGAFQWRTTIGSDVGQQLRLGKNLMGVRRSSDYTDLVNRLWAWGAGEGETLVRLGKGMVTSQPQVVADLALKWYDTTVSEWGFRLGGTTLSTQWRVGWPYDDLKAYGGACRFPGVNVPQGAEILVAELRLTAHADPGSGSDVYSKVYMEDANDAAQFSTIGDYEGRSLTTKVNWDNIPAWTGLQVYSRNVVAAVQTVVDRVGWESGNAMVIFWEDHDYRTTEEYQSRRSYLVPAITKSPLLYIEYTLPGAVDYLEDLASKALYDFAAAQVVDVSITDSATLFEWAVRLLGELAYPHVSYGGSLVDLERYGFLADAVSLGDQVKAIDEALSLEAATRIIHIVRSLNNRMDVQIELSNRARTVLDKMNFAKDPRWRQHFY